MDNFLDLDDEDLRDLKPYSSITNREPLEDLSLAGQIQSRGPGGMLDDDATAPIRGPGGYLDDDSAMPSRGPAGVLDDEPSRGPGGDLDDPLGQALANIAQTKVGMRGLRTEVSNTHAPFEMGQADLYKAQDPMSRAGGMRGGNAALVRQAIAKRRGIAPRHAPAPPMKKPTLPPAAAPSQAPSGDDDLLKLYLDEESKGDELRSQMPNAYYAQNMGHAMAQAAQGPQTPQINHNLYANMQHQNDNILKSQTGDLDRRQKIISAIQQRKFQGDEKVLDRQNRLDAAEIGNKGKITFPEREKLAKISAGGKEPAQNLAQTKFYTGVVDKINGDTIVKPADLNLQSLIKAKGVLDDTSIPLTPQSLADAERDIAGALNLRASGGLTEGQIARTELDSLGRKVAEAYQKFKGKPVDLRIETPEIVEQIVSLNRILIKDYKKTLRERKNYLYDRYEHGAGGFDPEFNKRINMLRALDKIEYGDDEPEQKQIQKYDGTQQTMDVPGKGLHYRVNGGWKKVPEEAEVAQ